jgi:hypothetical protein
LIDDWSSFGPRSTGSGTVTLGSVEIKPFQIAGGARGLG